jgi:hypothetical protein
VKTEDNGTTFELYFPVTRDEIWKKENPLSIKHYKGSEEMILVVDDEESQREISCKTLFLPMASKSLAEKVKTIHLCSNGYKLQEVSCPYVSSNNVYL